MLVPMVPGLPPGARAPAGPSGTPPGPQPQAAPGPTPGSSVCGTPPTGSPTATPPGSLPRALFHGARSPSPPPMTRHRSNTHPTSGPMHQVPVYAANRAAPNRPVPVYALPQPVAPQAPMEPQISEGDQMMEASPVEADVETRPCTPELPMMRQQSQSGLSVEIAQELGNNARLEIEKMVDNSDEKNPKAFQGPVHVVK
eukprot:Skav214971  [mRNA]  locus=scaffold124:341760:343103:+ [translate_table: standard]